MTVFKEQAENTKMPVYNIYNQQDNTIYLGQVKWNANWRKYCFHPVDDTVFDAYCLMYLVEFMKELQNEKGN